jgi:hypothetical protein
MVTFFISKGADLAIFDFRGRAPMDEAEENGFIPIHVFIDSITSDSIAKQNCRSFSDGLFAMGVRSSLGFFHRKFSDVLIQVNGTVSFEERLNILRGPYFKDGNESELPSGDLGIQFNTI